MLGAREVALKILYNIDEGKGYSNLEIDSALNNFELSNADKGLTTELVYGVITHMLLLDNIVKYFSTVKLHKISKWIINILRIGAYQLIFLSRIPVSATCNESVKLAKRYGHQSSSGFVNGVLRNIARTIFSEDSSIDERMQKVIDLLDINDKSFDEKISLLYSHPEWLVKYWKEIYGEKFTEELCSANNSKPKISIRTNTIKTTSDELITSLSETGIKAEPSALIKEGLIVDKLPLNNLFKSGLFLIQDEAAMLVSKILDPKPGESVLDVCSAPGGKTTHIAELMRNKGKVMAFDIHQHRVQLVNNTVKRLGIEIIETRCADASVPINNFYDKFDKVLVDAPCSGLGVIRRKPEIKWTKSLKDIEAISEIQMKILNTASKYVKKQGRLVYSTCTIGNIENKDIIEEFLQKNNEFVIDYSAIKDYLIYNADDEKKYVILYPNIHNTDGFFIAVLKRKE